MKITKATKWALWWISISLLSIIIFTVIGIQIKKQFGVENANVDREIYEESKSYVHGKIQDLAKYYEEYQKADEQGKKVIRNMIQINFAEFDSKHINNDKLKIFFIEMRGF